MVAARKRLLHTAFNRRVGILCLTSGLMILAHRLIVVWSGSPLSTMFAGDMLIIAMSNLYSGLLLRPALTRWAIPWIFAVPAVMLSPEHGGEIFFIAAVGNVALATRTQWFRGPQPEFPATAGLMASPSVTRETATPERGSR